MKKNTSSSSAFTLVELLISITISILLMASIGVFMSSGMQNLFNQQASLKNMHDINDFANDIRNTLNYVTGAEQKDNSVLLKRNQEYDKGGFTLISIAEKDNYCENEKTNHLMIKDFIPFMGSSWKYVIENTVWKYTSSQKKHTVVDKNWKDVIVGTGYFGKDFTEGSLGAEVPLNSPTGLALDDEKNLYIADTLNNRILYRIQETVENEDGSSTTEYKIYTLLDEKDGLLEPTGLYYKDATLYIANSGKWEILSFSSKSSSKPTTFTETFTTQVLENVARIDIEFHNENGIVPVHFPDFTTDNFTFTNIDKNTDADFVAGEQWIISYYFSDFENELTDTTPDSRTFTDLNTTLGGKYNSVDEYITEHINDYGKSYMDDYLIHYIRDFTTEALANNFDDYITAYDDWETDIETISADNPDEEDIELPYKNLRSKITTLLQSVDTPQKEKIDNYHYYIEQKFETIMKEVLQEKAETYSSCFEDITFWPYLKTIAPFKKKFTCTSETSDPDAEEEEETTYNIEIKTLGATEANLAKFVESEEYSLELDNLDLSTEVYGNLSVKIVFYGKDGLPLTDWEEEDSKQVPPIVIPWVSLSDGKIYTKGDNTFTVIKNDLNYPNALKSKDTYDEFTQDKIEFIDLVGAQILSTPIKSLQTEIQNKLLTLKMQYYRTYNCNNPDENEGKVKTFLFNANLK